MNNAWTPASHVLPLADNQVHVWKINLLEPPSTIERLKMLLSPEELSKAHQFHKADDGRRYIAAHGTLRELLAHYLRMRADVLTFSHSDKGKPALSGQSSAHGLQFNLTHSRELALLAVVRSKKVGIDVEHLRELPNAEAIAGRYFTAEEREALDKLPVADRTAAFFRCWTRKEALMKCTGEGLSTSIDAWNVPHDLLGAAFAVEVGCRTPESLVWELTDLKPADGYVGACAVEGTDCSVARFEFAGRP